MKVRDWGIGALLAGICVVGGLIPVLGHHSFSVPRNDDWVYVRAAETFIRTGSLKPDPFSNAMAVGQSLLAAPLMALMGPGFKAAHIMGVVVTFVALLFTYAVCRLLVNRRAAALVTLTTGLSAQVLPLVGSFMTDTTALAFCMAALWAGGNALRRSRVHGGWLTLALLLVFAGITVRETTGIIGIALVMAVIWLGLRRGWQVRSVVVPVIVSLVAIAGLLAWRSQQSSPVARGFHLELTQYALAKSLTVYPTLSLMTLPALVLLLGRVVRIVRERPILSLALTAGVMALTPRLLLGNYLTSQGVAPETIHGYPPLIFPQPVFDAIVSVSHAAAAVQLILLADMAIRLWKRYRTRGDGAHAVLRDEGVVVLLALTTIGVLVATMLMPLVALSIFDRYLLPAAPLAGALWLRAHPEGLQRQGLRRAAVAALAAWAVVGLLVADSSATFDGGKWRAAQKAVTKTGVEPKRINGGYEWFGYWQNRYIEPREVPERLKSDFWTPLFPDPGICAEVNIPPWSPHYLWVDADTEFPRKNKFRPGVWDLIGDHTERTILGVEYYYQIRSTTDNCAPR